MEGAAAAKAAERSRMKTTAGKANAVGDVALDRLDLAQLSMMRKRTSISDVGKAKHIKDHL